MLVYSSPESISLHVKRGQHCVLSVFTTLSIHSFCRRIRLSLAWMRVHFHGQPRGAGGPRLLPQLPQQAQVHRLPGAQLSSRPARLRPGGAQQQPSSRGLRGIRMSVGELRCRCFFLLWLATRRLCKRESDLQLSPPQCTFSNPEWFYRHVDNHVESAEPQSLAQQQQQALFCQWAGTTSMPVAFAPPPSCGFP